MLSVRVLIAFWFIVVAVGCTFAMSGNDASAPVNDCNLPELIPVRIIDHSHASDEFEIPRDAAISERSNHSQVFRVTASEFFFAIPQKKKKKNEAKKIKTRKTSKKSGSSVLSTAVIFMSDNS